MHCVSISHKTAPVCIRQLFAFSVVEKEEFEERLLACEKIHACIIISTCNRSEIYFSGDKGLITFVENELAIYKDIDPEKIRKYFLVYSDEGAISHLFRVTGGLDSMVLGEGEILRQVRDGYKMSLGNKHTNNELNTVFQGAIRNAKLVRTETKLSKTPVSVGTLAANKIIEFLKAGGGSSVLLTGITGKTGSIVAKNLCGKKGVNVIGTLRSHNPDFELYRNNDNIKFIDYKNRYDYIRNADVIISATSSPQYTFTMNEVTDELGDGIYNKLFVDLAVPCDIDKDISLIKGIELIDIDYFEKASEENNILKQGELEKAEKILYDGAEETLKNIYFQKFCADIDKIAEKTDFKGLPHVLHRLKKSGSSEQLKTVLDMMHGLATVN